MMIDTKTLRYLSGLSDDKLEQMIRLFASGLGADIPKKRLDGKTISGIRSAMEEITEGDLRRAQEIITVYKKGKKN